MAGIGIFHLLPSPVFFDLCPLLGTTEVVTLGDAGFSSAW